MLRKLLVFGWVFGVPVALIVCYWRVFLYGTFLNVGPEVVERIRPYMTLAEVEAIVGGPPGDYRPGRMTFGTVSGGCCWENRVEWATERGRLVVVDGRSGSCCHARDLPRGIVDSVRWTPAESGPGLTNFVPLAALCFAGTFSSYVLVRQLLCLQLRVFPTARPRSDGVLNLPRYPT